MPKLLRTIRLDPSDGFVFPRAAAPDEWAVPGAFRFFEEPVDLLIGKMRSAFRSGFLGLSSLGWSTLAIVSEVSAAEVDAAVAQLAGQLEAAFGAPDRDSALAAAREEILFAQSLCDHPVNTLIALHRRVEDGEIKEAFRTLLPGTDAQHSRAFEFHFEDEEMAESAMPQEEVDLRALLTPREQRASQIEPFEIQDQKKLRGHS